MHRSIYPYPYPYPYPRRHYIPSPCGPYGYPGIRGGCYPDYWDHYDDYWDHYDDVWSHPHW